MIPYAQQHEPDNVVTLTLFLHMPSDLHIFLCTGYVDMRKSIDGLISIVEDDYGLNPFAKSIFCFCGRRADRMKMLFFNGDCFMLMLRRMEEMRFQWPRRDGEMWQLSQFHFINLLKGEKITESNALRIFHRL